MQLRLDIGIQRQIVQRPGHGRCRRLVAGEEEQQGVGEDFNVGKLCKFIVYQ